MHNDTNLYSWIDTILDCAPPLMHYDMHHTTLMHTDMNYFGMLWTYAHQYALLCTYAH